MPHPGQRQSHQKARECPTAEDDSVGWPDWSPWLAWLEDWLRSNNPATLVFALLMAAVAVLVLLARLSYRPAPEENRYPPQEARGDTVIPVPVTPSRAPAQVRPYPPEELPEEPVEPPAPLRPRIALPSLSVEIPDKPPGLPTRPVPPLDARAPESEPQPPPQHSRPLPAPVIYVVRYQLPQRHSRVLPAGQARVAARQLNDLGIPWRGRDDDTGLFSMVWYGPVRDWQSVSTTDGTTAQRWYREVREAGFEAQLD
jgi:hypothetical protein